MIPNFVLQAKMDTSHVWAHLANKEWPLKQQTMLPSNQALLLVSMDNGKQGAVLCSMRRQLGHS